MSSIAETLTVEFDLDDQDHCALCREAERLKTAPEDVVRRAVAAWLTEIQNDTTQ